MQQTWHYTEHGSGFPLVLGTSYLWEASMWAPQITALAQHYRVIVPQLPGHGNDLTLAPAAASPTELAQAVAALLDTLDVTQCALVGLSVGGMWGAELALAQPQRVRSLVLMDTTLATEPDASRQRYLAMLATIEACGRIPEPLIEQIVPLFFRPQMPSDDPLRAGFAERLRTWPAHRIEALVALGRGIFTRPERLPALAALDPQRTLVACGRHDIPRPPEEAAHMADTIGCRLVLIADAGHMAPLENPDAVTDMLTAHLAASLGGDR